MKMISLTVYYRGIKKRQRNVKHHSIELYDMNESLFTSLEDYRDKAIAALTDDSKSYEAASLKVTYWESLGDIKRANLFDERNKEIAL